MAIEVESPEHFGYGRTKNDLMETSVRDRSHRDLCAEFNELLLSCGDHPGGARLRELIACQSGLASAEQVLVTAGGHFGLGQEALI